MKSAERILDILDRDCVRWSACSASFLARQPSGYDKIQYFVVTCAGLERQGQTRVFIMT